MAIYPLKLAENAAYQNHTGRLAGLWFLPNRPKILILIVINKFLSKPEQFTS
jgi:hypothetical protein